MFLARLVSGRSLSSCSNKNASICTAGRKVPDLKTNPRTDTKTSFLVSVL